MPRIQTAASICCLSLAFIIFSITTSGQQVPSSREKEFVSSPPPVTRWTVSLNPAGLLELPSAIGAGIGWRLNEKVELWSETSLLRNWVVPVGYSLTGIRQILQVKRFIDKRDVFFLAAEIRYKSYTFGDSTNFYNLLTRDTLINDHYHERIFFWGVGLQLGVRLPISKNGRLQLDMSAGLGIKEKTINKSVMDKDYRDLLHQSIDINQWNIMQMPGSTLYVPASIRLVYSFGKKLF